MIRRRRYSFGAFRAAYRAVRARYDPSIRCKGWAASDLNTLRYACRRRAC